MFLFLECHVSYLLIGRIIIVTGSVKFHFCVSQKSKCTCTESQTGSTAAISKLVDAMYRIRKISAQMLEEKMKDSNLALNDSDAKRDIMSILVRARKAELDGGKGGYAMSDRAMMDQVVSILPSP